METGNGSSIAIGPKARIGYVVQKALSAEHLEAVFRLRYQVYVVEEQKFGGIEFSEKQLKDEFDDHPDTINLLMSDGGKAIGVVRMTGVRGQKLPSDKLYDFDTVKKTHSGLIPGNIGMLAIRKEYRTPRTFTTLMLSLGKLLLTHKYDYYMFTLNHECSNLFCRIMGAKMLSDKFWSAEICNYIIPMILYKEQVLSYVKKFEPK